MKIIKINTEHYIVVDDSQIKEGDWYIDDTLQILQALPPRKDWINSGKNGHIICKKITHSTQPLEKFTYDNLSDEVFSMDYHNIKPISLQEIKELIGEVDVEKKMISPYPINTQNDVDWCNGYQRGYNQALEDNKEKKYTEEQLIWSIQEAYGHGQDDEFDGVNKIEESIKAITKHLQPKTEWEVEIVDGKLKLK